MPGYRLSTLSVTRFIQRTFSASVVAAAFALLAPLPQAWGGTPTFTVANTTFPSTAVGDHTTQNVTLTVNTAVPITSISIAPGFTEYTIGAITGCTVDATGNTTVPAASICTIPVTFTPKFPGTATAPPPISRSAPLLVADIEGGIANGYSFALSGSATGSVFAFAPGFLTSYVGNPTFAGGFGTAGCANQTDINGDGCPATDARIYPSSMALDAGGNLYIADGPLSVVHRVDAASGIISVYAGQRGVQTPICNGCAANKAVFYNPYSIAIDQAGNVYLDDPFYGIWKINSATGIVTLITGNSYSLSQAISEGKPASQTALNNGVGYEDYTLFVDSAGNIYFASYSTGTVYRIDAVTDLISYVAGNGTPAYPAKGVSGGGLAVNAQLGTLQGMAMDSIGNLYIADGGNALVYKVDTNGIISIFAGTQETGAQYNTGCTYDSGDWGPATSAFVGFPDAVAVDPADNVYIGEPGSEAGQSCPVRRVDAATGIIHTVAGEPPNGSYGVLSGVGATESFLSPNLVSIDGGGNIYVGQAEVISGVSKVSPSQSAIIFPEQSEYVTSDMLVTASNVGIGTDLTLSNYPFPIALVSSTSTTPTPLPFTNAPLAGTNPEDCSSGTVPPGGICGIQIAFYPDQATGFTTSVTDTVENNSLGVAGSSVINISGSAYNGATATLTPNPISFPSQPVGTPTAATAVQFGIFLNPALTYTSTTITGPDASSFTLSPAAITPCAPALAIVAGGGDCNLGVIFNPQSGGPLTATLTVTWMAAGLPYSLSAPISGIGAQATPAATPVITPATGTFNAPVAVAITDATTNPTIDYSIDGTAPSVAYTKPFTVSTNGAEVQAIATASGFSTSNAATPATYTIQPYLEFNAAAIGATQQLIATFSLLGSTVPTVSLHYGHDYTAGSISCTPSASNLTELCTVPVTFVPTLPGGRKDALFLTSGGSRVATVLLYGVGQAPLALFLPGVVTTSHPGNYNGIEYLAVDDNDTAYVGAGLQGLFIVPKSGTVTKLPDTTIYVGPSLAIDGAGVLYTNSLGNTGSTYDTVQGVPGTWNLPALPGNGITEGWEIATVGNTGESYAFSINFSSDTPFFYAVNPDGTYQSTALPAAFEASPYSSVNYAVTVDSSENVFAGSGPNLYEIMPPTTIPSSSFNTGGTSNSLSVDAAGTVYQPMPNGTGVEMLPASSYGTAVATISTPNLSNPGTTMSIPGLVVGKDGTVYLIDGNGFQVIDRSQETAIDFGENITAVFTEEIYNGGNQPLIISSIATSTNNFTLQTASSSPCGTSIVLQPGALCQVAVQFTPTGVGDYSDAITFTSNTSGALQPIPLSGTGVAVAISTTTALQSTLNPSTAGQSVTFTATVTQASGTATPTGTVQFSVDGSAVGSPVTVTNGSATYSTSTLTVATHSITAVYTPTTGSVFVTSSATALSQVVNAAPTPTASLSPNPLAFGGQVWNTTSPAQIVTVSNTGNAPLTNIVPTITGTNLSSFAITTGANACTSTTSLASNATCNIYVTFTPVSAGNLQATLSVADNAASSPQTATMTGTGTAVAAPAVSLQPSPLYIPTTYPSGSEPIVVLENTGTAPLSFAATNPLTYTGAYASFFSFDPGGGGNCFFDIPPRGNATIAPGATCNIVVNYTYNTVAGALSAYLTVADNAANSPQTAAVTGIGRVGQLQFAPAQLSAFAGVIGSGNGCQDTGISGPAVNAMLCHAESTAADLNGNVYIADLGMNVVYKVDSSSNISVFAGYPSQTNDPGPGCSQQANSLGDGCLAIDATIGSPAGLAVDSFGNVYIADAGNKAIRVVNVQTGIITTFLAATNGSLTFGSNTVNFIPGGLTFDPSGNLYVTDYIAAVVLKVDTSGNYTIFAGVLTQQGYNGDDQPATSAELYQPTGVASDLSGNIYIADSQNNRIREVDTTGNITTVAGNGTGGNTGDGGPAVDAEIYAGGVAVDAAGDLYFSTDGTSIRKVDLLGNISTIAGGGTGGTGGPATSANLFDAVNPGIDLAGDVLIPSDSGVARVGPQGNLIFGSTNVGSSSTAQAVIVTNTGNAPVYFYNPNNNGVVHGQPRPFASAPQARGSKPDSGGISIGGGVGAITGDFAIGSGGTCVLTTSGSIAAGASCSINVTFSPTSVGAQNGTITLYAEGPNTIPSVIQLSGTGLQAPVVATPQISPPTGTYSNYQNVTITDTTPNAVICYTTTSGSTPAASNGSCTTGTAYSGQFSMAAGTSIQAIATLAGSTNSALATATYTLQAAPPTLLPPGGTYVGAQSVTLSTTTTGAQIWYTTNGNTPTGTAPSILYNSNTPISVTTSGTVINAITVDDGMQNSTVSAGTYILQYPVASLTAPAAFTANTGVTTAAQAATLANTGNALLTSIVPSLTGTNPKDFAIQTTGANICGSTLAAGASCSIYITFTPASATTFSAILSVADNASGSPQTVALSGTGTVPTFAVTSPTPVQTVQPGGAAKFTINVNPVNGSYTNVVTLAVTKGLPAGATASFSPRTVTPGPSGGSSVLTIQTAASTTTASKGSAWPLTAPALALIGLFFLPGKRRRRWLALGILLVASLGALTILSGCGGGFSLPQVPYTITVTGTSGNITQTTTVQLTLQ